MVCLIALPGLAHLAHDQWLGIAALFALLFGCLLLGAALFDRNVVWIVHAGRDPDRRTALPFGKLHRRSIWTMNYRRCACEGASANRSNSPSYSRPDRAYAHLAATARHHPGAADHRRRLRGCCSCPRPNWPRTPLDAANAAIRLGKPVSSKRATRIQGASPRCLPARLAIPLVYALWSGKLSGFGIAVGSFGAIMAFLLIRHLYRASGWLGRPGWRPQALSGCR